MVFALGSSVGADVKWRATLERALGTWESVSEWADYISYLARLQKAVKSNGDCSGDQLPLQEEISESLARCMEPDLPSGVHQTCITVYDTVFTTLGHKQLCATINTWLPGLLPVASYAAFNVKPMVVELLEKHIIAAIAPRPRALKSLFHPILLSLLPSLEEESGECYQEICSLVELMRRELQDNPFFWRCVSMCIVTSSDSRLGALNLLGKHASDIDEQLSSENEENSALFVRACCNGLKDGNVLVQRGFLDVLARHLPLSSPVLQQHTTSFDALALCACLTLLRRDMSLNRRLWLWLLGPEPQPEEPSRLQYLQRLGAPTLVRVLLRHLGKSAAETYQISRALMDRWEIGATLSHALLQPVLAFCREVGVDQGATLFFNTLEPTVVWDVALHLLEPDPDLVLFMVQHFDVHESAVAHHIPLLVAYTLAGGPVHEELLTALVDSVHSLDLPAEPEEVLSNEELRSLIAQFYTDSVAHSLDGDAQVEFALSTKNVAWYLLHLAGERVLRSDPASKQNLNAILALIPSTPGLEIPVPHVAELARMLDGSSHADVSLFVHLVSHVSPEQVRRYVSSLVHALAQQLAPAKFHSTALAQELWRVNDAVGGAVVSSALSAELARDTAPEFRANFFACVWISAVDYSSASEVLMKPLLLFLDLADEDRAVFLAYLQSAVVRTGTTGHVVKMLIEKLELEKLNDAHVFNYCLRRTLDVLRQPDVRSAYVTRYFQLTCTLLLQWFEDPRALDPQAYAEALELAELTVLDPNAKDGRQWLESFVIALLKNAPLGAGVENVAAGGAPVTDSEKSQVSETFVEKGESRELMVADNAGNEDAFADDQDGSGAPGLPNTGSSPAVAEIPKKPNSAVSVPLMRFIARSLPLLQRNHEVEQFVCDCILRVQSEVEYEQCSRLLDAYLGRTKGEGSKVLVDKIVVKLESVPSYSALEQLHLFTYLESVMSAAVGSGSEAPEQALCMDLCVHQSSKYWLILQDSKPTASTEVVHTTGRLKTRIRKLMTLLFNARPEQAVLLVAKHMPDLRLAVRFVHVFEGTKYAQTLEILMRVATEHDQLRLLAAYLDSLENDVWGDVWPAVQQFISTLAGSEAGAGTKLEFLVASVAPRFANLRLRNYKKASKEFSETYLKILTADALASSMKTVTRAVVQLPQVFTEPDRQATALTRLLNLYVQKPEDVSGNVELLRAVSQTFSFAGLAPTKVWTKIVGDFLFEHNFLEIGVKSGIQLQPVVAQYMQCEKDRFVEFETKLATYGTTTNVLFAWTSTKTLTNVNLRRLAYFILSCPPDVLPLDVNRLANQLANLYSENAAYVFMLLRACMLREMPSQLMMFAAFKLQRVLTTAAAEAHGAADPSSNNAEIAAESRVLLEACKLLDLAIIVQTEQFQLFEWLFVSPGSDKGSAGAVLEKLARAPTVPDLIEEKRTNLFNEKRRRPLLPRRATSSDLPLFLARVQTLAFEDACSFQGVDQKYCEDWLLCDLFSSGP